MALSPQWLDELKSRITLSALIQRTVKLTRAGREWKACCPFHSENTPSFYVNDQKGFYHCFGCQQHGGAIDWMMEQHGLPFMDAVKELAAEAGMEVPAPDPRAAQRAEERATLHDVMKAAQDWFVAQLASPGGSEARAYLERRGLNEHTIRRFGFGWAPDDKQAIKTALSQFDEKLLIEAGLLIEVEDKIPYSRFRGRVMLPIQDARERVIAFGGRILADRDGVAKYLNSPDTPLFDKGRTLYNLHRAAAASRKTNRVIVAEGYMDVIALAAAGMEDAVAPMGTALTEQQIELLWRMADKPVLCFDGDKAGTRAAMRAAERALPLLRPGHSLQVVHLPAGLDPDDLIKRDGRGGMDKLLEAPKSLLDLVWEHERDAAPLASPEDKAGLKARLLEHVDAIQHPDIRSLYRRELLDRYGAFAYPPREKFTDFQRKGSKSGVFVTAGRNPVFEKPEARQRRLFDRLGAAIVMGLLRRPDQILRHSDMLLGVPRVEVDRRLLELVERAFENDGYDPIEMASLLLEAGFRLPKPPDYHRLRFPFVWPRSSEERAVWSLDKAIKLYHATSVFRMYRAQANDRAEANLTNESFEDQQRHREYDESVRRFPQLVSQLTEEDVAAAEFA